MKNNKFSKIKVFNGLKGFVLGFVLAASLVAGAVYAWNAVWHGTDWIESGAVIDGQKIAESLEYLKNQADDLSNRVNNLESNVNSQPNDSGKIIAGCYARFVNFRSVDFYCWGGARSTRTWDGYSVICPNGTQKINVGFNSYCRSWDGGDGGSAGSGAGGSSCTYYNNAICEKI